MSSPDPLPLAALVPRAARERPRATVTVTGDDGNPSRSTRPLRPDPQHGRDREVTVPAAETPYYTTQVFDRPVRPSRRSPVPHDAVQPDWKNFADYRGNGTYTVAPALLRRREHDCTGAATTEHRFQYVINAGTAVTAPAAQLLTRAPNSFATNTHELGVALNPGASTYEVRYALGGVTGPDGAISGPSARRSSTAPPASPTSASTSPAAT